MALTVYDLSTGRIRYTVEGSEGLVGAPGDSSAHSIADRWDGATYYVVDQEPVLRPATGLPVSHQLASGADWSVPDVPEGTVVLVNGSEVGTVDATGLELRFALAGVWRVDLRPPFPWIEASCEVIVT